MISITRPFSLFQAKSLTSFSLKHFTLNGIWMSKSYSVLPSHNKQSILSCSHIPTKPKDLENRQSFFSKRSPILKAFQTPFINKSCNASNTGLKHKLILVNKKMSSLKARKTIYDCSNAGIPSKIPIVIACSEYPTKAAVQEIQESTSPIAVVFRHSPPLYNSAFAKAIPYVLPIKNVGKG